MSITKQRKVAVDSVAEEYWSEYYKDSGYGEQWVRKIPVRIKAELRKKNASKALPGSPTIHPLATVITDDGVSLEGIAVFPGPEQKRKAKAFVVDFDHDGNVQSFDVVDAK